jgi:hypothetical protein
MKLFKSLFLTISLLLTTVIASQEEKGFLSYFLVEIMKKL